ncbi:putative ribosome-binding factor A, mitochondrial [Mustela lutreola]|uniref:putative ribosome-binding factor A, mitochondrial n=1 Tax=Mustela lutreola TaxID=9666 RepID=UPI0027973FC4|nr:putative ribosome-binding factor A, mitochondrial [Mustela lutreola]XP_058996499.1 putative ribosome-binding factor A, mitochondrial [Mustela lutreola]XP_058996500.1 putative ribosome-binding factor A, mitochondrial [Mustela lutreola]
MPLPPRASAGTHSPAPASPRVAPAGSAAAAMWAVTPRRCGFGEGLRAFLRGGHAALPPAGARALRGSPVSCGKNLLKKFASKTKKKFWYEGPSLGSHLMYKPSRLEFLTKSTAKKTRRDEHVRLRALNGLLYKALTELLCTPQVSQEICDLNVQLSKVSLTADFSACRVYWRTEVPTEQNASTEAVLQRSAAHMRHLLMSQQTLRNVPPIVFIRDKGNAALAEVERLLAVADLGPRDEKEDSVQDDIGGARAWDTPAPRGTPTSAMCSSLCGIDHEALHKQIMEYKRKQGHRTVSPEESRPTAGLAAETREGKVAATPCADGDLCPRNHLLGAAGGNPSPDLGGRQGMDSSPKQQGRRPPGAESGGWGGGGS